MANGGSFLLFLSICGFGELNKNEGIEQGSNLCVRKICKI